MSDSHTHIDTDIHTYTHTYTPSFTIIHTIMYRYTRTHTHKLPLTHTRSLTHTLLTDAHMHTPSHTHTRYPSHTLLHIHIYTHMDRTRTEGTHTVCSLHNTHTQWITTAELILFIFTIVCLDNVKRLFEIFDTKTLLQTRQPQYRALQISITIT